MKTHKLVLLAAFVAFSYVACAQDYAFKVLANKGNNEIKSGDSWQPLKTGASLKTGDEVRLSDNAYIGLVHNSGKPVELKAAGVHKVSSLESQVGTGSSVLNKYTDFILSSNSAESQRNRMNATGAVHRDITSAAPINLLLPDKEHSGVFNQTAIISWEAGAVSGPFVVTVMNMFEDVLTKEETPGNSFEIDLRESKYATETAILIEVSLKANPKQISKRHLLKKLSTAEVGKISAALEEMSPQLSDRNAMNELFLAGFYEQNELLIDAIYAYQQAIRLQPDVPTFKESYEEFLQRNKLK